MWFLSQRPAEAHRNRITYLTEVIVKETHRVAQQDISANFQSRMRAGREVQNFLVKDEVSNKTSFLLLDFNDETLQHTQRSSRRSQRPICTAEPRSK